MCARLALLERVGVRVVLSTIKEKFGSARIYTQVVALPDVPKEEQDHWCRIVDAIVSHAERDSANTCEVTGEWGMMHQSSTGWYRTLNPDYAAKDTERGWVKL